MDIEIRLDEKSLEEVRQYLSDTRFQKALAKTLLAAGLDLERAIVENITKRASNTGALAQSWQVQAKSYDEVIVFSNLLYAPFVEYGTKPHRPPIEPIMKWVRLKLGKSGRDLESTSWAVWHKIATKGTPEKRYARDAADNFNLERYVSKLLEEWNNAE